MDGLYGFYIDSYIPKKNIMDSVMNKLFGNKNPSIGAQRDLSQPVKFQKNHSFEKRKGESKRVLDKYPNSIPVICEVSESSEYSILLDKCKYLVPKDLTVGQFLFIVRKRLKQNTGTHITKLQPDVGLYLFTEQNVLPPTAYLISQIYQENKNKDGFLYLTISLDSTFG
jgi:GABA(A) receptor-associated protein